MPITMQQIADLAGVSRGTVDRVLNNRPGVKPETFKRIKEIAETLNYKPNIAARALKYSNKKCKIGILVMEKSEFTAQIVSGIESVEDAYRDIGVEIILSYCEYEVQAVLDVLDSFLKDDVSAIAVRTFYSPKIVEKLNEIIAGGIPVVTFNSDLKSSGRLCFIGQNNTASGRVAGELMGIALHGKGNILIVNSSDVLTACKNRTSGFVNLCAHRYPKIKVIDIMETNDFNEVTRRVRRCLTSSRKIDGIYLADSRFFGVCTELLKENSPEYDNNMVIVLHDMVPSVLENAFDDSFYKFFIGQEPEKQGMYVIKVLVDYVYYGIKPPDEIFTNIDIRVRDTAVTGTTGLFTTSTAFSSY